MRKRKRERERERQIETSSRRLQIFSARNVTRILLVRVRRQHSNTWVVLLPKPKSLRRCFFLPLRFLSRVGGVVCPCFVYLYSLREETKENVCRFVVTFPPYEKITSCARFLQRVALVVIERMRRRRKNSKENKEENRVVFFEPRRRQKKKK